MYLWIMRVFFYYISFFVLTDFKRKYCYIEMTVNNDTVILSQETEKKI